MTTIADANPGEQGSIEWVMARVGKVTCSRFADVMDKLKSGAPGAKRSNYMMEVVSERLTGQPTEHYVSAAMEHGTLYEPNAKMAYEAQSGNIVVELGFIHHPTIPSIGGSCDGVIDDDGIIEVKAPTSQTHLRTILSGECNHLPQIMGYLWILGRQYCDFISYDPRMPDGLSLYVQRIERDDTYIANLEAEVISFEAECSEIVRRLEGRRP